jgi:hypothetical protein
MVLPKLYKAMGNTAVGYSTPSQHSSLGLKVHFPMAAGHHLSKLQIEAPWDL